MKNTKIYNNVLELIGWTPMVRLNKVVEGVRAEIVVKLEYYNPSGSLKDRIARHMIEEAEKRGDIKPGYTVVEPTSGNTGCALALVCAVKGYDMVAVLPEAMSLERKAMMKALGARLELTPSFGGQSGSVSKEEMEATVRKADELSKQPRHYMANQFANPDNVRAHRETTGEEIWQQTEGRIDAFVMGVGTSGTAIGVSQALKAHDPSVRVYAVEPATSAVLSGEEPGYHRIQGIGEGFIPELVDRRWFDEIIKVADADALVMACRLAREEGIFGGISAGANVWAAIQVAEKLEKGARVVTIIADTGLKYLSTQLFEPTSEKCALCHASEECKG